MKESVIVHIQSCCSICAENTASIWESYNHHSFCDASRSFTNLSIGALLASKNSICWQIR